MFILKKEKNSEKYFNMDKFWGHYAKWSKGQILWVHRYETSRVVTFIETGSPMVVATECEERKWNILALMDSELYKMIKALQMAGSVSCIAMWMYLMPINDRFKWLTLLKRISIFLKNNGIPVENKIV